MMSITSRVATFEDLRVYQRSRELVRSIYKTTRNTHFFEDKFLREQIHRASVSIVSNIAEGYERGTNAEFIRFLYISKGSCGELRAQLGIANDLHYIKDREFQEIEQSCRKLSAMLANLITYLKNSRYRGNK